MAGTCLAFGEACSTGQPTRLRGFSYQGFHRYFLTFCTFERRPHFLDGAVVGVALSQILRAATQEHFVVLAYTFMPDHVHLLIEGVSVDADASRFMTRAKQASGYAVAQRYQCRLWQRYGYEHVLRDDEAALGVARYILENPARAGLVVSPRDYPHSGCPAYSIEAVRMRWRGDRHTRPADAGRSAMLAWSG